MLAHEFGHYLAARFYDAEIGYPIFGFIPFAKIEFGLTPVDKERAGENMGEIISWGSSACVISLIFGGLLALLIQNYPMLYSVLITLGLELIYMAVGSDTKKLKKIYDNNINA